MSKARTSSTAGRAAGAGPPRSRLALVGQEGNPAALRLAALSVRMSPAASKTAEHHGREAGRGRRQGRWGHGRPRARAVHAAGVQAVEKVRVAPYVERCRIGKPQVRARRLAVGGATPFWNQDREAETPEA